MKRIALVILYFGSLPNYTKLFFHSLKYNPSIDLLLFTDQLIKEKLDNLIVYNTTFEEIKKRIQNKFDFPIILDRAYKLCDYKPTYGYIFDKELKNYDFWGYCDLDIIIGNLRSYLKEDILNKYDKIYQYGHLCLYRNTIINNKRFMSNVGMNYKEVFTTSIICVFDEIMGMQKKYDLLNVPTYIKRDCADISPWQDSFRRVESHLNKLERKEFNYSKQIFYWEKGHLFRAYIKNNKVYKDEFNYLHFQKREMKFKFDNIPDAFYITREGAIKKEIKILPNKELIMKYSKRRLNKELKMKIEYKKFIWVRRINKYIWKK